MIWPLITLTNQRVWRVSSHGNLSDFAYIRPMSSNKGPSPQQIARAEKQKIASTEGAKALAEARAGDVAIRKNMERLRALRLAKEAEDRANGIGLEPAAKKKAVKKTAKAKVEKPKLSEYLAQRRDSGHQT